MNSRAILPILILLGSCSPQRNEQQQPAPVDSYATVRAAVLADLRDPDSARFGSMTPGKSEAVCGTVNAKNGFGGFTGPTAFVWTPGRVVIYDDPAGWGEKGAEAEEFAALGCSIGPDQGQALAARKALDQINNEE
jgi:hypothetical protein